MKNPLSCLIEAAKKQKLVRLGYGPIGHRWDEFRGIKLVIMFNSGFGLLAFYTDKFTVGIGMQPEDHCVYKWVNDQEVTVECRYIWGRATEPYDHCLEYFGFGPLGTICWRW